MPREVKALAGEALDAIAEEQALAGELGFVILHRCGESFYFLIVVDLAQRERGLGDGLGQDERRRARIPALAARRGRAPSGVLRLGAARGLPRVGRLEPLPALRRAMRSRRRSTSATPTPARPERGRAHAVSVSADEARRLALALPGASEQDHHGRPSFRVGGRIFATLPDERTLNAMLDGDGIRTAVARPARRVLASAGGARASRAVQIEPRCDRQSEQLAALLADAWEHRAPARPGAPSLSARLARRVAARELGEDVERVAAVAREQHERVEDEVGDLADLLVGAGHGEQHLGRLLADLAGGVLARPVEQARDVRRGGVGVAPLRRSCARAPPGKLVRSPQQVSAPVWQAGPLGSTR